MRKTKLLLAAALSTIAWTGMVAQTAEEYEAALTSFTDGATYRITTEVNGTKYYVTTEGSLTSEKRFRDFFTFQKVTGNGNYPYDGENSAIGVQMTSSIGKRFTNAPLSGSAAVLNPGVFSTTTGNRTDWEAQVLFLKDGKLAVRSCNVAYDKDNGWTDCARTFWTYSVDPVAPLYSYEPAYVWTLEELTEDEYALAAKQGAAKAVADAWASLIMETTAPLMSSSNPWISDAADSAEGCLDCLTDGNNGTFFHSDWHGAYKDGTHYIEATLPIAESSIVLYYVTRNNGTGCPLNIEVSGSNDGTTWENGLATIEDYDMPQGATLPYMTRGITLDKAYSHIRFYVHRTNSTTEGWFCLAEANVYAVSPAKAEAMTLAHIAACDLTAEQVQRIYALDDELRNSIINVTYQVKLDGVIVATETAQAEPNSAPIMPESLKKPFLTFSEPDVTVVNSANNVVTYTATWNGPFELSANFATAHWYDMAMRGTWYVTSAVKADDGAYLTQNANTMGLVEDSYQWAFIGNPYAGFKIINKAEGEGNSFAWTDASKTNAGIPTVMSDEEGYHAWNIVPSTNSSVPSGSFCLNVPGTNLYINQYGGAGGSVKFWDSSNNLGDAGSAFTVFDVPTNFASYVADEIAPYFETTAKYFVLTEEAKAAIGYKESYKEECSFEEYKSMKDALAEKLADNASFVWPETGYYRLQSYWYPGYYMAATDFEGAPKLGTTQDPNAPAAVIKLEALGDYQYAVSAAGLYASAPQTSVKISLVDDPTAFEGVVAGVGYVAFTTEEQYGAIHCANSQAYYCVGWEASAQASVWTVEDADIVRIAIGEAGYATTYLPFPVEPGKTIAMPAAIGTWTFDDGMNGTGIATMTASEGVTVANGIATIPVGDKLTMATNLEENVLDTYSFMMDIMLPNGENGSNYTALFQNDLSNVTDASLYINYSKKNGRRIGYASPLGYGGSIEVGEWYRVVFVCENSTPIVYVNGQAVATATGANETLWRLTTGAIFFGENDGEENEIQTSEIRFWNVALSADEVSMLGSAGTEIAEPKSLIAYTGKVVRNSYVALEEVKGAIPALTAVILKGEPAVYEFNVVADVDPIENDLKGTLVNTDATGKYILGKPEGEDVAFYRASGGTLKANKAYLETDAEIKAFYFTDDATGISAVESAEQANGLIYNIAGQRLSKTVKGINIVDGKKVLK